LRYLNSQSPAFNSVFRAGVVQFGGAAQRVLSKVVAPLQPAEGSSAFYPLRLLRSSVAPVPSDTLRDLLPDCEEGEALVFEPEDREPESQASSTDDRRTVFYFPGCGSERLHSEISMATIHVLLEAGTRVVLPPPFLCCGFPAQVNGKADLHSQTVLRDTIVFNQIRTMFGYLDFDGCVISCGTCRDGLSQMDTAKLFGRVVDVAAYLNERGVRIKGKPPLVAASGARPDYLYHAPCHDSLDGRAEKVLAQLGGFGHVQPVPHCCSEAGTLALSRPDITDSMLHRKREAFAEAIPEGKKATVLTNCPACVQGLGRCRDQGVQPLHTAVALAEKLSGPTWKLRFTEQAGRATVVAF
jgi:Fe-S oxidoreductase